MHPDVAALLSVQSDDMRIHELEDRLAALAPRLDAMAKETQRADAALAQARQTLEAEERRQREVHGRIDQYRQLEQKNQTLLNSIANMREATAATAQLEQTRRMIVEAEREQEAARRRVEELRHQVAEREAAVRTLEERQQEARGSLDADRQGIESELAGLRGERDEKARTVPRPLLVRYDRIRSRKRVHAVFPLRGQSCGNCDTVIPLQRRNAMVGTGVTEVCEGCGVLLYAAE